MRISQPFSARQRWNCRSARCSSTPSWHNTSALKIAARTPSANGRSLTDPAQTGRALFNAARVLAWRSKSNPTRALSRYLPASRARNPPVPHPASRIGRLCRVERQPVREHHQVCVQCGEPPHAIFDPVELVVFGAVHAHFSSRAGVAALPLRPEAGAAAVAGAAALRGGHGGRVRPTSRAPMRSTR